MSGEGFLAGRGELPEFTHPEELQGFDESWPEVERRAWVVVWLFVVAVLLVTGAAGFALAVWLENGSC